MQSVFTGLRSKGYVENKASVIQEG